MKKCSNVSNGIADGYYGLNELSRKRRDSRLVPICSFCNRTRDKDNRWKPLKVRASCTRIIEFTHGVCPKCRELFYPETSANHIAKETALVEHPSM